MKHEDSARILSHSQLFHGLDEASLLDLPKFGRVMQSDPGAILIEEGHRVPGLHVILEGAAHVLKGGQRLTQFGRGAFFGEISLFGVSLGATATIVVGPDRCSVLLLTTEALDAWAKKHPSAERLFLRQMCTELSRRLYATSEKLTG